jgi:hypothetical protein
VNVSLGTRELGRSHWGPVSWEVRVNVSLGTRELIALGTGGLMSLGVWVNVSLGTHELGGLGECLIGDP